MKLFGIAPALAIVMMLSQCTSGVKKVALKTEMDTLSYCLGYTYAKNIKEQGKLDSINKPALYMAIEDYYGKKKPIMENVQMEMFLNQFFMNRQTRERNKNSKKSKEFLEKNKNEKGVVITATGLQYIVLKEGNGPNPRPYDTVSVAYKGTTLDGTVFDSTGVSRPAKFLCQGLIPGWIEALKLMNAGAHWKLFISPELGYGNRPPMGSNIKPNDVLIFDVELLKVIPGKEQPIKPAKK